MGKDRNIRRICAGCGGQHKGSPNELIEGGQCMSCKMLMHEINEPMPVDRHTLENIAHVLKVPLLVEVQLPGSLEERNQEPHLRRVAERIAGKALIVKLDAKEEHEMAWALGVRAVPTLLIIRGLKVLHSYEGLVESSLLEEWLRQAGRM